MISNTVIFLALLQTSPTLSLPQAADAVARGEDLEDATARLLAGKKHGLWVLHDRAKNERGEARQRLFEVIGRFGSSEAEWALLQELKSGPIAGRLGAVRGLAHAKTPGAKSSLLRAAGSAQEDLRQAIAESLLLSGGLSDKQLRDLTSSASDSSREIAVRYLALTERTPLAVEIAAASLRDRSARVVDSALVLAGHVKDPAQIYTLAEIARTSPEHLAIRALEAMSTLESYAAASELGSVVASEGATERAWRRATELLRDRDRTQLVRAMARASRSRRAEVARIGAESSEPKDFEPVLDMLDDPSADVREAALELLGHSGAAGRTAAEARLKEPLLPELEETIRNFLKRPPSEALTKR